MFAEFVSNAAICWLKDYITLSTKKTPFFYDNQDHLPEKYMK